MGHAKPGNGDAPLSPLDEHLGARLQLRRSMLGISQDDLARLLGVSVAEIAAMETGQSRIGASKLFELAGILGVPFGWFFECVLFDSQPKSIAPDDAGTDFREQGELEGELLDCFNAMTPQGRRELVVLAKLLLQHKKS